MLLQTCRKQAFTIRYPQCSFQNSTLLICESLRQSKHEHKAPRLLTTIGIFIRLAGLCDPEDKIASRKQKNIKKAAVRPVSDMGVLLSDCSVLRGALSRLEG